MSSFPSLASPASKPVPALAQSMAVATDPQLHSTNLTYSMSSETIPRSVSSGELWSRPSQYGMSQASSFIGEKPQHPIGAYPDLIQEYAIIEDLLFVFMGIAGNYIKFELPSHSNGLEEDDPMDDIQSVTSLDTWDHIKYDIDPTLDPSLRHLVEKLLPLASYYMSLDAFVVKYSRFEYGTINHALCSALRDLTKEYLNFIAQLEHQFRTSCEFTLHRLWFYAQDTLQQMQVLHQLVHAVRALELQPVDDQDDDFDAVLEHLKDDPDDIHVPDRQKGAALLNLLADRMINYGGDPKCKQIYTFLLSQATQPYFNIMQEWIYRGHIKDAYSEFMVLEKSNVKKENLKEDFNDAYWEMRYTLRRGALIPSFLEPLKNQILLAGKYLNVVRECGVNIVKPDAMQHTLAVLDQQKQQEPPTISPSASTRHQPRPNPTSSSTSTSSSSSSSITPLSRSTSSTRPEPFVFRGHVHKPSDLSQVVIRNDVWTAVDGGTFVKNLEVAYRYANHTLLHLLLHEQQLNARLRSLKHYFFLDQSDFLTSFLDLAKDELKRPADDIPITRLQSLMDIVLRNSASVTASDPFKEDVVVVMSPLKLVDQLLCIINVAGLDASDTSHLLSNPRDMGSSLFLDRSQSMANSISNSQQLASGSREALNGYDALTLDYTVTFPLSLVISRKALTKYQLLFRHLLCLKHVEDLLCQAWMEQKERHWRHQPRPTTATNAATAFKFRAFSLRSRMLSFVQQFTYYVTNEVLEPNWQQLHGNLAKVDTVDEVLQYHSDFLDSCLKECMLTNSKLLRIFNKIVSSCMKFANHMERFSQALQQAEDEHAGLFGLPKPGKKDTNANQQLEACHRTLTKLEEGFGYHMRLLMDALNYYSATETVQFLCLVVRLDFNGYYKNKKA
ncbi:hypothetical protein DM01DRAFT_1331765 [Hesseltinella vesiculosa]|uniref:Spindle pole body component n=1 Tax=Hesseltinella vesiculosa TaxID=101127 RepID=A0A1X2GWB6_9FUNG|nr:hypothetical protein DM01DRAFT_1331765 [Hesseltinella vesiculosa]